MKILFVCSSNVCRSPYAEFMFRRMVSENEILKRNIENVKSCAVFNRSKKIFSKTRTCLLNEGFTNEEIDKFKPSFKYSDTEMLEEADIIIGMSKMQYFLTPRKYRKKYKTLSQVAIGKIVKIPDPFLLKSQKEYNDVMNVIKTFLGIYANNLIDEFTEIENAKKINS